MGTMPLDTIEGFVDAVQEQFQMLLRHPYMFLPDTIEKWEGLVAAAEAVKDALRLHIDNDTGTRYVAGGGNTWLRKALDQIAAKASHIVPEDDRNVLLSRLGQIERLAMDALTPPTPMPLAAEAEQGMVPATVEGTASSIDATVK